MLQGLYFKQLITLRRRNWLINVGTSTILENVVKERFLFVKIFYKE